MQNPSLCQFADALLARLSAAALRTANPAAAIDFITRTVCKHKQTVTQLLLGSSALTRVATCSIGSASWVSAPCSAAKLVSKPPLRMRSLPVLLLRRISACFASTASLTSLDAGLRALLLTLRRGMLRLLDDLLRVAPPPPSLPPVRR
jgi:hypothetical protein